MKPFFTSVLVLLVTLTGFAQDAEKGKAPSDKKLTHRLSLSALYLHVSDPDWSHMWWRRGFVPSYEVSYKGWGLKTRFFILGKWSLFSANLGSGPYTFLGRYEGGISYQDPITKSYDVPENVVSERAYRTLDIVATHHLLNKNKHLLQAALGTTFRKGYDEVYLGSAYNIPIGFYEGYYGTENYNEWGGMAELSYSYNFWKRFFVSAEASYRIYPQSTGLFTGGVGLGLQFQHRAPRFMR